MFLDCSILFSAALFCRHTVSYLRKIKYIFKIYDKGKISYWSGIIKRSFYYQTAGQNFLTDPRICGNRDLWKFRSALAFQKYWKRWNSSPTSRPRHHILTKYRWKNLWIKIDHYFPPLKFYLHLVLFKQVKCKYVRKRKTDGKKWLNSEWFNMATSPTPCALLSDLSLCETRKCLEFQWRLGM